MPDIYNDNFITFKEDTHQYFDLDGIEYKSMSRVLNSIKIPFDEKIVSKFVAKRDGLTQEEVLNKWKSIGDHSREFGTKIHNALEDYVNAKKITDDRLKKLAKEFSKELVGYKKLVPEFVVYDKEFKIAGQTDLLLDRQNKPKSGDWIIDLIDYKTNIEKGIYFDSIWRKNGVIRHYKKFLLSPLDHLEECNYNLYSLQLSGYGYMLEKTYGVKIGKLFIVWIMYDEKEDSFDYTMIPVPYMKMEIEALFNFNKNLKTIK
jgi:hypothetical protein